MDNNINGSKLWKQLITPYFTSNACHHSVTRDYHFLRASYALKQLLAQSMIIHLKDSINIPKPVRSITKLRLDKVEAKAYNTLVTLAHMNLVVTDLDEKQPGRLHLDSLLNSRNRSALQEIVKNLRIATCGGGSTRLRVQKLEERFAVIRVILQKYQPDIDIEDIFLRVRQFMNRCLDGEISPCNRCNVLLSVLLLVPCGHVVCPNCCRDTASRCAVCNMTFDWEDLQQMQPGFEAAPFVFDNPSTSTDPPVEGYTPTPSAKIEYLMTKIVALEKIFCDVQATSFTLNALDTVSAKVGFSDLPLPLSALDPCRGDRTNSRTAHAGPSHSNTVTVPKIVIFSQFSSFLDRVVVELKARGISYSDIQYGKPATKARELLRFRLISSVRVLMLSTEGSHGLDLSFVTHIFLMDTILNDSIEQQVISRAYRMGAKHSVIVDQIYTADTVDEHIFISKNNNSGYLLHNDKSISNYDHDKSSVADDSQSAVKRRKIQSAVNGPSDLHRIKSKETNVAKLQELLCSASLVRCGLEYAPAIGPIADQPLL